MVDSQSVPTVEAGRAGSGYDDAGKRVKGRKRHIAVDVDGNLLAAQVHPAGVQDRDGAVPLLVELHRRRSTVQTVFADGGYAGDKLRTALREAGCQVTVDVVRKPADSKGLRGCFRGAGWSSGPSGGCAAAAGSRRTSSAPWPAAWRGSGWRWSVCSSDASRVTKCL